MLTMAMVAGCSPGTQPGEAPSEQTRRAAVPAPSAKSADISSSRRNPSSRPRRDSGPAVSGSSLPTPAEDSQALDGPANAAAAAAQGDATPVDAFPEPPVLAAADLAGTGIRRLDGTHLVLYTDLPSGPEVDELPRVFDLAVPQWCAYFGVPAERVTQWRMAGYLMKNKTAFDRAGMLPPQLPPFEHGYQLGVRMWMYEQPSNYYRRHMLLHEGTHAFMNWLLGGTGPPWFSEGMAELLGTHRWQDGQLQLAYFPSDRAEVPEWGRVKIIRDRARKNQTMAFEDVLKYGPTAHRQTEPYGWCWAACALGDGIPRYRQRFRGLAGNVALRPAAFNAAFRQIFADDYAHLITDWQLFVRQIDYGYDLQREAVKYGDSQSFPPGGEATVLVNADRGWQSTGWILQGGRNYQLTAAGRYQIAKTTQIWWCEPDGVTIRYFAGQPLGRLLAAIVPTDWTPAQTTHLATPNPIGRSGTISGAQSGVLFLRVNDAPAELHDNAGQVRVVVRQGS